jgi:uncharacterized protein (TIGR02145 family)
MNIKLWFLLLVGFMVLVVSCRKDSGVNATADELSEQESAKDSSSAGSLEDEAEEKDEQSQNTDDTLDSEQSNEGDESDELQDTTNSGGVDTQEEQPEEPSEENPGDEEENPGDSEENPGEDVVENPPQVLPSPYFSKTQGTYYEEMWVDIFQNGEGEQQIRYTTDGSEPNGSSTLYEDAIWVNESMTIKARSYLADWEPSETFVAEFILELIVQDPTFSVAPGTYDIPQTVSLSTLTFGAQIRYTTDGSDPTESSPLYQAPLAIESSMVLKARAFKDGWSASEISSGDYTIELWCDIPGNCGTFTDTRDSKEYKWVKIGAQVWMAENLNFGQAAGVCYNNVSTMCTAVGKLYNWGSFMQLGGSSYCNTNNCVPSGTTAHHQGVCPEGWHVPSVGEWATLFTAVGGKENAGAFLKANTRWSSNQGADNYSFTAYGSGYYNSQPRQYEQLGEAAYWWTTQQAGNASAIYVSLSAANNEATTRYSTAKINGLAVRCVQD